jgi:predicted transcriptional regulator
VARKKSPNLTEAELRLMEVLWEKKSATVAEVVDGLSGGSPLAYSTVLTTLRILENKGHVRHSKDARAFIYSPVLGREQARQSALTHLVRSFFEGSPELLVLNLLEMGKIDPSEIQRLRKRIAQSQRNTQEEKK